MTASGADPRPGAGGRRLLAFYAVVVLVVGAVAALAISAGESRDAELPIAGGYDVSGESACLGAKFDVLQSGRYVNLANAEETLGGKLELRDGRLTGEVSCID